MGWITVNSRHMWPIRLGQKTVLFKFKWDVECGEILNVHLSRPDVKIGCTFCWGTGEDSIEDGICEACKGECMIYPPSVAEIQIKKIQHLPLSEIGVELLNAGWYRDYETLRQNIAKHLKVLPEDDDGIKVYAIFFECLKREYGL